MAPKFLRRAGLKLARVGAATVSTYLYAVRPWHLTWGASEQEVEATLPGDELIQHPRYETTRAISIQAPPAEVWPWVQEVARARGAFYEEAWGSQLFDAVMDDTGGYPAGDRGLSEGDVLAAEQAEPDETVVVARLDPERALVLHGTMVPGRPPGEVPASIEHEDTRWADWSWAFVLEPSGEKGTRLVTRLRGDHRGARTGLRLRGYIEPLHFLQERRMLRTVKRRAEHRVVEAEGGTAGGSVQGSSPRRPPPEPTRSAGQELPEERRENLP